MAAYKDLVGQKITKVTSNPGEPKTGQMWYNSTSGTLRGLGIVSAWASASPLITGRHGLAGGGTQTASAFWGGDGPSNKTEEYNGSGFSSGGNLPYSAIFLAGCGTQTAGLACGGDPGPTQVATACTYDGSSWTGIPSLNTARSRIGATGITSAALAFGGGNPNGVNNSEEYSGSSWSEGNNLNTARRVNNSGGGPQTAAIVAGGAPGPSPSTSTNATEEYNGSSWTTTTNLGTATREMGSSGTQTAFLVSGGLAPSASTTCQQYDGTSWTTLPAALPSAVNQHDQEGTTSAAITTGGNPSLSATNELTVSTNTITAAAWSSGGNLNTGRQDVGGTGTKSAGLAMGGRTGSSGPFTQANNSEEYDGTSWTEGNNLNTARGEGSGAGTQTAAVYFGGAPDSNATENYNGTSWTTSPGTLNTGRSSGASFGASYTSAVFCGGYGGARIANVEEWNGSAWTNATALPEARYNAGGAGIESAGIVLGGSNAPGGTVTFATSVEYNGSSWTAGGTNTAALEGQGMNGTQTACISYGGPTSLTANSSTYDGTTFVTSPNMAANRSALGASKGASITNTMGFGGSTPPNRQMTNTEEFTSEVETANVTDFTTS